MADALPQRSYGGVSAEQRRAERRAKLIASAVELLSSGGLKATTVREVADRAKVSRRFFYESFDDLDSLLGTVVDEVLAAVIEDVLAALAEAPREVGPMLRASISAFIQRVEKQPSFYRATLVEAAQSPELRDRLTQAQELFVAVVKHQANEFLDLPDEMQAQLDFSVRMLIAGSVAMVAAWTEGRHTATASELVDQYARFYEGIARSLVDQAQQAFPDWEPKAGLLDLWPSVGS